MTTRPRRAFRPQCGPLEPRGLLSTVAPAAEVSAASTSTSATAAASGVLATTVAAPGNGYLPLADWMTLHQQNVARARTRSESVAFLGDSIVYFWGDPNRAAHPEIIPAWGTSSWQKYIAPERAENFGVPGDYTQSLLWRVENGELAGKPKVAVVLIGINDLIAGASPAATAEGVAAVVNAVRVESPDTKVLLLGLLPPVADPKNPLRGEVDQVNSMLAGWSGTVKDVRYFDPGAGFVQPNGVVTSGLLQTTSIHPTALGYQELGQEVQPVLRQVLSGHAD